MKKISFETLKDLSKRDGGLTDQEVASQRSRYGANEIVEVTGNPWLELATDTLKDPMIWFLVGVGTAFMLVGDKSEAIILFVAILPLIFMDAFLHWRTQASTSSLKGQLASVASVIRGSQEITVDATDLVPGDLISISSGTFLPADGVFQNATDTQVDESVLTGEAFPIAKRSLQDNPFDLSKAGEISVDPSALGFAGTKVLTGEGRLRILSTGRRTSYGEIVQSVSGLSHERTPLQTSIANLVRVLIYISLAFCVLLAVVRVLQGHGWLDALLSAATLAVAAIPEEFPVVFTFYLGVGVYRLAKRRALVRRAVSVENIGRVTHVCTDKTGTITIGRLELTHLIAPPGFDERDVLTASVAASNPKGADPVDIAIRQKAQKENVPAPDRFRVFPFTEDRKRETVLVVKGNDQYLAYMKGAPETVLASSNFSPLEREAWLARMGQLAREGHKVLACARRSMMGTEFDPNIEPMSGFEFCGLLAFEDPPREGVAEAIDYCRRNQIGVLMITGDHPDTAVAIAREVGLGGSSPIVVSAETEPQNFQEEWLDRNPEFVRRLHVVARCTPLQKLRIVNALKKSGELVAVTGDGVNDVPALKAADVGIAMGERGTRSAREVSSIVLSDDNFRTIVNSIMEGRQLFANLKRSFEYLLLIHIPFVLTAALIPLFGYPLLYLPIHIIWLELVLHPSSLFAFQDKSSDAEIGSDQRQHKAFFTKVEVTKIVLIGLGVMIAVGLSFLSGLNETFDIGHARARALVLLTLWSAGIVISFSRLRTTGATVVSVATILSSVALIQIPSTAKVLHVSPLRLVDWLSTIGLVCVFALILNLNMVWARSQKDRQA